MEAFEQYLQVAQEAAHAAGRIQQRLIGSDLDIRTKTSQSDLVTRADRECEEVIRGHILNTYSGHAVLGEEEGSRGTSAYRWVVDPLDGTVNYAHGFPFFCVSIALEIEGTLVIGVVHDPSRQETFTAIRGQGAQLNGNPIQVSDVSALDGRAMLATGFPYQAEQALDALAIFQRFLALGLPIRRPGAAALDLCYVACGRFDGFWESKLKPWDCAAGNLIIEEAGGRVSNFQGQPHKLDEPCLVASNTLLHEAMLKIIGGTEH